MNTKIKKCMMYSCTDPILFLHADLEDIVETAMNL